MYFEKKKIYMYIHTFVLVIKAGSSFLLQFYMVVTMGSNKKIRIPQGSLLLENKTVSIDGAGMKTDYDSSRKTNSWMLDIPSTFLPEFYIRVK